MLGIHISEGTAEGWFGQGKKSAIVSIVILAVLISGIAFGIFAAVNAGGETSVSQPDALVDAAALTSTEPAAISETEPGAIVLTVEELIGQVIQNPDKYKKGTIMQVTGAVSGFEATDGTVYLRLIQGWKVSVMPADSDNNDLVAAVIRGQVNSFPNDFVITVRAKVYYIWPEIKHIDLRDGILVTDAK
ncbi:MAG: hypothetical protein A2896_00890 [Candidatus Nealsonbacteria bacterium RIFCSPLOWO2_01_FULL_43_32]|uniref:Uncharacterized protein n=1 Tax=Candidatus Nealsonbacteria bacterium RIFCSPLOWO2_01_FULL_43_32 TaxID=1801672 RepID=A0A1G2EDJ7_9BACT|nr:MAG: hypothetical protein A2896_00890 [Candidatus Nealsonbacteria bacterium RIFCSPLOWO2_01_FULL_43_32]